MKTALSRTCLALRGSTQVKEVWAAAQIEIQERVILRGEGGGGISEMEFSTIERDGTTVIVAPMNDASSSELRPPVTNPARVEWIMKLEDGKWRWCGSRLTSTTAFSNESNETPQIEPSSTNTSQAPTATFQSSETITREPTAVSQREYPWVPCQAAPPSNLRVGDRAYVGYEPPLPNRVRNKPNWDTGGIIGRIHPGEEVELIGGPECNNQVVWWRVRSDAGGLVGWTVEGDQKDYWLIRLP